MISTTCLDKRDVPRIFFVNFELRKLTSSLYVDSDPVREDLGWSPRFTIDEELVKTLVG